MIKSNIEKFNNFCQELVKTMGDWYFEINKKGKFIESSESINLFLGFPKRDILKMTIFEILPSLRENDLKIVLSENRSLINHKTRLLKKNNECIDIIINLIPSSDEGNRSNVFKGIGTFNNPNENVHIFDKQFLEKKPQMKLNKHYHEFNFLIDIKDKFRIIDFDGGIQSRLGFKYDNILNTSFLNLVHEKDIYKFINFIKSFKNKEINKSEFRLLNKKGKPCWFSLIIAEKFNDQILIVAYDINRQKILESKLQESDERLKLIADTVPEIRYWKLIAPKGGKTALDKSRQMLSTVIDTIPQYIFWKDENLKFLGCNKKLASVLGFDQPEEIIGMENDDISWLKTRDQDIESIENSVISNNHSQLNQIEEWNMPNGKKRWFEVNRIPLYDSDDIANGILTTFEDITDRKIAEEKLKESEAKYRGILENIKECYFEVDLKGNLTFCNEAFIKESGFREDEIIGINFAQFVDDEYKEKIYNAFNYVYETERGLPDFQYKGFKKNGEEIVVETSIYLRYNSSGKKIGFSGILRIITEKFVLEQRLKKSEQKYRLISENAYDLISIINENFIIEYINEKPHIQTVGFSKEDMVNHSVLEFVHPDDKEITIKTIHNSIQKGYGSIILRLKHKKGKWIWVEAKGKVFKDVDGNRKAHLISRDITERKLAERRILESEEKLKKMNKELEEKVEERTKELRIQNEKLKQLDKLKNDFISMVTHELKTPLISISGYIDLILMREKNLNKEIINDLKVSMANVERLKEYINQLMDVMKIDAKKMELIKEDVNLKDLLNESISELDFNIKEKNLDITLSIPGDVNVFVDKFRMKQVFSNLLSNAIKFSYEEGMIEINLKDEKEDYIICIKDEGIGLKQKDLEKLFGKFVMVNKEIEKFSRGSGLGLYIAKGIVESHGGFIKAKSEGENMGSEFIFSIPKKK